MDDDQKSSKYFRTQFVTDDDLNIIKHIVSFLFNNFRNLSHCVYCLNTTVVTHSS